MNDKNGHIVNIEELTVENTSFRKVLYTTPEMQLVLMSLKPGEDIGSEVHPNITQFFRVEVGKGTVILNGIEKQIEHGRYESSNIYGDGKAGKKIVKILSEVDPPIQKYIAY